MSLEVSMHYAAQAGDLESLKALARQEERRAEHWRTLLVAVLEAHGPVVVSNARVLEIQKTLGISVGITPVGNTLHVSVQK